MPVLDQANKYDHALGRRKPKIAFSGPSKRGGQPPGGLSESTPGVRIRMVTKQGDFPDVSAQMGSSGSGLVRQESEHPGPSILFPREGGRGKRDRCFGTKLGFSHLLRLPPIQVNSSSPEEIFAGTDHIDTSGSVLAEETMVLGAAGPDRRTSPHTAREGGSAVSGSSSATRTTDPKVIGLASEESLLKSKGLSDRVIKTLLASRKKVTQAIYVKYWKVFCSWLDTKKVSISIPTVLEFLQDGVDKGLAISTLKVQITALSVFLDQPLAIDPLVSRFFKGLTRIKPVPFKILPKWDLSIVLQGWVKKSLEEEPSLRWITLKTVFLVAISTARRISELQALSVKEPFLQIFEDRLVLRTDPGFLPKVVTKFHRTQEIVLPSFCGSPTNPKEVEFSQLDVRACVLQYLEMSKNIRKSDALFVLHAGKKLGSQASKNTIARWIKQAIVEAYKGMKMECPFSPMAHSTRALSTSWAERAGATPEQICRATTWSSYSTFMKHYRLDLISAQDQAFGRKVLQAVVPP
ncbi:uncharacterized protein LOC143955744 [Lithobates pipiens]